MRDIQNIPLRIFGGGNFLTSNTNRTQYSRRAATIAMAVVAAFLASMPVSAQRPEPKDTDSVYVCTGSAAYAYHTRQECQGLQRCTATIKHTTVKEARREGRKFCGYCRKVAIPIRKDKQVTTKDVL